MVISSLPILNLSCMPQLADATDRAMYPHNSIGNLELVANDRNRSIEHSRCECGSLVVDKSEIKSWLPYPKSIKYYVSIQSKQIAIVNPRKADLVPQFKSQIKLQIISSNEQMLIFI